MTLEMKDITKSIQWFHQLETRKKAHLCLLGALFSFLFVLCCIIYLPSSIPPAYTTLEYYLVQLQYAALVSTFLFLSLSIFFYNKNAQPPEIKFCGKCGDELDGQKRKK